MTITYRQEWQFAVPARRRGLSYSVRPARVHLTVPEHVKKTTGKDTGTYAADVQYAKMLKLSVNVLNNYRVIYAAKVAATFFSHVYAKVSST